MDGPPIVDGHLDLAENVTLFGRDLTASLQEQETVSLPELVRGGIAVVMATVTAGFKEDDVGTEFEPRSALYSTPEEAEAHALEQIALYRRWEDEGRVRVLESGADLEQHLERWRDDRCPGLILLMEGADPIVRLADLADWWAQGLRVIGLTCGDTRYGSGVTGSAVREEGGLTEEGIALLGRMAELGFAWDVSHLTEQGIRQGLELGFPRVCASHANPRALAGSPRHLRDPVIRAIADRGGVVGVVLYNGFLDQSWPADRSIRVTVETVGRHVRHIAGVGGWACVGIGSDLDGGFGRGETPEEIETVADLHVIGSVVPPEARAGVLGENWLSFLRLALPRGD